MSVKCPRCLKGTTWINQGSSPDGRIYRVCKCGRFVATAEFTPARAEYALAA